MGVQCYVVFFNNSTSVFVFFEKANGDAFFYETFVLCPQRLVVCVVTEFLATLGNDTK